MTAVQYDGFTIERSDDEYPLLVVRVDEEGDGLAGRLRQAAQALEALAAAEDLVGAPFGVERAAEGGS